MATLISALNKVKEVITPKTDYQQNVSTPVVQNTNTKPTTSQAMAQMMKITQTDPQRGYKLQQDFQTLQADNTSMYYNPYTKPTNQAVLDLGAAGFDISKIDDDWYNANSYLKGYYNATGTTNNPSKPGAKASQDETNGYNYWQVLGSRETTDKAKQEIAALKHELTFKATKDSRNMSDDEIMSSVDWNKYPTLADMNESAAKGAPIKLNEPVDMATPDWMGAVIWGARNNGGTGSVWQDMANNYLDEGNQWEDNETIREKLDPNSDKFDPYTVGSTMYDECMYFDVPYFDNSTIQSLRSSVNFKDEEAAKNFSNVVKQENYTEKLEDQFSAMEKRIDRLAKSYSDRPWKVVEKIQNDDDNEFSDLFDLNVTLAQGTAALKKTTRAIGFNWNDVQQSIYKKCEEERMKETPGFVANMVADAIRKNVQMDIAKSKDTDTGVDAVTASAPVISDAELRVDQDIKGEMEDLQPAIERNGTDTEKKAIEANKTGLFDKCVDALKSIRGDFSGSLSERLTNDIKRSYADSVRTISEYEGKQNDLQSKKADLERLNAEYYPLNERYQAIRASASLTGDQYDHLMNVTNRDDWDHYEKVLNNPERYNEEQYNQALYVLYEAAGGQTFDWDVIVPAGEQLWSLLKSEQQASPIERAAQDAKESGTTVMNVMAPTGGNDQDENTDTEYEIAFDKDENGDLHFVFATGNRTGTLIDNENELNSILGYDPYTTVEDLSDEEMGRYRVLGSRIEELNKQIEEDEKYLYDNEASYKASMQDRNMTKLTSSMLSFFSSDVDSTLLPRIDFFVQSAQQAADIQASPYNRFDYYVMQGDMDRETASMNARMTAYQDEKVVKLLQDTLAEMDSMGIEISDEERSNNEKLIKALEHEGTSADYASLSINPDFDEKAASGKAKAADATGTAKLLTYYTDEIPELNSNEYHNLFNELVSSGAIDSSNSLDWYNILKNIEPEEVNRYFYQYDEDPEAAQKYFEFINDPDFGELAVRSNLEWINYNREYASSGPLEALGSSIASVIMKIPSAIGATVYRATGGESPYNALLTQQNANTALREGTKDYITSVVGEDSALSGVLSKLYDVGMGLADYKMASNIFSAFSSIFEGSKLGSFLTKSTVKDIGTILPMSVEASNATYQNVLLRTNDVEKANEASLVTLLTSIFSHTVVMKSIHSALSADTSASASRLAELFKTSLKSAGAVSGSSLISEMANYVSDRLILQEDSQYETLKKKYKDELDYSDSMAGAKADAEIWQNIWNNVFESGINAAIRSGVVYAANLASYGAKVFQAKGGFKQLAKDTGKLAESAKGAARRGINQLFPERGEDITLDAENATILDAEGNPIGMPVSGYIGDSGEQYNESSGSVSPATNESIVPVSNVPQMQKDVSILMAGYNATPTAAEVNIAAVLDSGNMFADKAASQEIVSGIAGGNAKSASQLVQGLLLNGMEKEDIVTAALSDGSGHDALITVADAAANGQPITNESVSMIIEAMQKDLSESADKVMAAVEAKTKEYSIANRTLEILRESGAIKTIQAADKKVTDAKQALDIVEKDAETAQSNLIAIDGNRQAALGEFLKGDTAAGTTLQNTTEQLVRANDWNEQAKRAVEVSQNKLTRAEDEAAQAEKDALAQVRPQAVADVEQQAQQQAEIAMQEAAAKQEQESQTRALNIQEAEAELAKRAGYKEVAKSILSQHGQSGEYLERNSDRMAELMVQRDRGNINTAEPLGTMEDADAFLRSLSRQTGVSIEQADLGDPYVVREKIIDKNHMIINSRLSTGDAVIGAAAHGITHGLEETGAYGKYSDLAMKTLYGGRGTDKYNKEIQLKIQDYARNNQALTPEGADQELVAEFTRLHVANKKFVKKAVSQGIGSDLRNQINYTLANVKGYKFKGSAKRTVNTLQKAERLLWEAINERARMVKEGYNGHTGMTQFSITGVTNASGLTLEVDDNDSYRYKLYGKDGQLIKPGEYNPEMVKDTPVGKVIDMSADFKVQSLQDKLRSGTITEDQYAEQITKVHSDMAAQRKFISDIVNMIGQYQDAAMVWELAGDLAFSCLKTNGDPQYSDSYDMGTICTKTQAILNVISDTQVKLGRALTKDEIDGIVYKEVGKGVYDEKTGKWKHGATPCPPCYVYATWVNKPARLGLVQKYQNECKDWSDEQITSFMNDPESEKSQKLWISICLADEHKDSNGNSTWTRKENPTICPDDVLLDLRRSGEMATEYPGTWTFMQKGGNAQGKAIAPYSDSRLGETIIGKAIGADTVGKKLLEDARNSGNPDYIPQFLNPFLIEDEAKSKEYFGKALKNIKAQNLKGGQRWQSWSDFRAEWGSDYLMEMLTMQALGAKVQTYTKVPEALDLFASAGFEVNMSLMPDGDGFEHNEDGSYKLDENGNKILKFSSVTGINPKAAEEYARKYGDKGNVQPMVVGISDDHIKAALAGDYITFVIPFHGSGGSVKRLQHLMSLLGEKMDSGNDYTKAQSDKFISGETNTNPNWVLREAILTGNFDSLTDAQKDIITNGDNPYLLKLYEDRYLNENSDAYDVFFSRSDAQQIYPYEYWDTNTTLATAGKNSERFIEYCNMLGVIPRFSGLQKKDGTEYANFSGAARDKEGNIVGYNPVPGYWKLLIDRSMYKRVYGEDGKLIKDQCTYHDPEVINVGNVNVGMMPKDANNTVGHSTDETWQISDRIAMMIRGTAASAYQGPMTLGNTPSEEVENAAVIKKAMYADSDEQLSAGGEMTDAELDQIIQDLLDKEQAQYPSSAVKLALYQTPEQQETVKEYLGAVNNELLEAAKTYKEDKHAPDKRITLSALTDEQAMKVKDVTGFDLAGYRHDVNKGFFIHNDERHGENGKHDQTMADPNDVARIGWVLENFDDVEPATDQKTLEMAESYGYLDKNQRPMPMVRYSKKVDNTLYVVEAVGENKWKKLHVVSAYMMTKNNPAKSSQGNAVTRMPHANDGLGQDVQNAYASPADESVTQQDSSVNLMDEVDKAIDEMSVEELWDLLGLNTDGTKKEAEKIMTVAVQDIKDEFDPTVYNGKLYVKPETLDYWLSSGGFASSNPDYAQAYITTMNPADFLRMTTVTERGQKAILSETKPLDTEELADNAKRQPIQLNIDEASGKITGHEGRHRAVALSRAGVTEIPVLLFDTSTKYSKTPKDHMELKGQDYYENVNGNTLTFNDVIPLAGKYREEIFGRYTAKNEDMNSAEQNGQRILDYSLGGYLTDAELLSMAADNGLISPEMIPYSYVPSTNVLNSYGSKQRQFGSKTAQGSDALHDEVKRYLFNNSSYTPDTNEEQIDRAIGWVRSQATENDPEGYYTALKGVMDPDFNYRTADGQARMLTVMGMAAMKADRGDERALQDEIDLADAYNKQGTGLGQALQARKLFRLMTPVGRKALLQREADRMNQNLADRGKKYRVSIPDELLEEAANARNEGEFAEVKSKVRKVLNEQIPVTWSERIIGWRMLSMLSAPKTHLRNILGNTFFVPMVGTKNKVAAVIEAGAQHFGKIDQSERTKNLGFSDPAARKFASARTKTVEDILRGNAKYGEGDKRQQERKIFGTKDNIVSKTFGKALQWWYDTNGKALEFEDWLFLRYHYTRALGGYMTARGLKPEGMKGTVLEDADLYAIQEAHKATYRDESGVANWLNKIGSKKTNSENNKALSVIQWIVNTRFPFKRTPINIGKRGIEYSPVGLGKSLTYDLAHLRQYLDAKSGKLEKMPKSAISPTEWIDKFSAGLTGTGVMIAGVLAAIFGIARAGFDKNDPKDTIAKMKGEQEYSIKPGKLTGLDLIGEDVSMTLDWAAPVTLPFFTGVALKEYLEDKGFSVGGILDLMMEVTEPMKNMSFMSGVSEMFNSNSYSTKDGFWQFIEKTGINFITSLIPTWAGQVASTVDGRRTTYKGHESLTGDEDIDRMIQQIGNKIPWLNLGGIPYTNDLGEEPEHVIASWAENLLSPAYFSSVDESAEMNELERLYLVNPTDNKNILPSKPDNKIRIDGEDVYLNGEQYNELKAHHGEVWRETTQKLIKNPLYELASDDSKAAMFNLADTYATQVAKYMTDNRYKFPNTYTWVENAYRSGNADDAIINKIAADNKTYYTSSQAKAFAEALYTNNGNDIKKYAEELSETHADASTVRKQLTAYFKPLYKEAYEQGDKTTMEQIEDILEDINDYVTLDKSITKYTKKKDFDKWIDSGNTVSDEEDEDETNWLDMGNDRSKNINPDNIVASAGGLPARMKKEVAYDDQIGQYGRGNIDLNNRQVVWNPDGSFSTEQSFSFYDEETGKEVLIPTVINGRIVSEDEAIDHYYKTGEYLGMFDTPEEADEYAEQLHQRQEWYYNR